MDSIEAFPVPSVLREWISEAYHALKMAERNLEMAQQQVSLSQAELGMTVDRRRRAMVEQGLDVPKGYVLRDLAVGFVAPET